LRGAAPSIEALIKRVGCKLTVEETCALMLKVGAVRKVGRRLAASTAHPVFLYPPRSKEQSAHHLSVLNALVWNFEHNSNLSGNALPWFERRATAQQFPEAALASFGVEMAKRATAFLQQEDALMQRLTKSAPSARHRRAHVQIFLSMPKHQSAHVGPESRELMSLSGRRRHSASSALTASERRQGRSRRVLQRVSR
jgi:hypothetical protein